MLANHFHEPPRRVVTFTTSAKALIVLAISQLVLSFIVFITGITFLHRALHPELDKSSPTANFDPNIAVKSYSSIHGDEFARLAAKAAEDAGNFGASLILLGLGGMLAGGLGLGGSLLGNKAMVLVHHVAAMFVAYLSFSVCIACNIYADEFARTLSDYEKAWLVQVGIINSNNVNEFSTRGELVMDRKPWAVVIPSMNLVVSLLLAIFTFASSLVVCNMFADGITEPTPCCHVTIAATAGPCPPCQGPMVAPCSTGDQKVRSRNKPASVEIRVRTDGPNSRTSSGSGSGAVYRSM